MSSVIVVPMERWVIREGSCKSLLAGQISGRKALYACPASLDSMPA